mgnify:CR=1 FL=1
MAFIGPKTQKVNKTGNPLLDFLIDTFLPSSPEEQFSSLFNPLLGGVFRQLGSQRAGNLINADELVNRIREQPNFNRFIELARNAVRKGLGEQFEVFRGLPRSELLEFLRPGKATTRQAMGVTTSPHIARSFAATFPEGHVIKAMATPESIMGMVPKRSTGGFAAFPSEQELIVDPFSLFNVEALSKFNPIREGSLIGDIGPADDLISILLKEAQGRLGVR